MSKVNILLAPSELRQTVFFFNEKSAGLVRANLPKYISAGTFEFKMDGEDAAEEAFDLTNNPGRDAERASTYGRGQSVSSGDVIVVDDVKYMCASFGWVVL